MDFIWYWLAKLLAQPRVANYLIKRSQRTPYNHIYKQTDDKSTYEVTPSVYMKRFWLFNPYNRGASGQERSKYWWFPWNIRIHHICREDQDANMHDHPWNARTVILKGYYEEQRLIRDEETERVVEHWRKEGDTARIKFGEYHSIILVPEQGVWTLFITGPYQGVWGFWVDGVKVTWKKYLGIKE